MALFELAYSACMTCTRFSASISSAFPLSLFKVFKNLVEKSSGEHGIEFGGLDIR